MGAVPNRLGLTVCFLLATVGGMGADAVVAVSSRVAPGYVRTRLSDGSFAPESYAFGEGGVLGGNARDAGLDRMSFMEIAQTVAPALARQKFNPTQDPRTTRLLIMVYWGATNVPDRATDLPAYDLLESANANLKSATSAPPPTAVQIGKLHAPRSGPDLVGDDLDQADAAQGAVAAENRNRDQQDFLTARLLGYDSWWNETTLGSTADPGYVARREVMLDELEDERYFVILLAYDWPSWFQHKHRELRWETRYSIRARGTQFGAELAAMTRRASQYFGRPSDGLVHAVPEGHVHLGEAKVVPDAP